MAVLQDFEFPHILWNLKVHYRPHTSPRLAPNPRLINPVHILSYQFFSVNPKNYLRCSRYPSGVPITSQSPPCVSHNPSTSSSY